MGPDRGVVAWPALDDDLGLAQSVEDLAVEQLIAKPCVETLDEAVLPRAASLGYKPPAPEVFVPAFAAWPAALRQPAPPATLAQRSALN